MPEVFLTPPVPGLPYIAHKEQQAAETEAEIVETAAATDVAVKEKVLEEEAEIKTGVKQGESVGGKQAAKPATSHGKRTPGCTLPALHTGVCPSLRAEGKRKRGGKGIICEHGRRRCRCKDCGGKGICEHGRQRHGCKEYGGKRQTNNEMRRISVESILWYYFIFVIVVP